jgi:hypothetical protein
MLARWFWNVLIALDQFGNAVTGGDPDETISSRADKAMNKGKRWGCIMCRLLNLIQKDHCQKSLEPDEGARAVIPD